MPKKDAGADCPLSLLEKWAAKHEHEKLKEGAWREPGLALLREKVRENGLRSIEMLPGRSFFFGRWMDAKEIVRY